MSTVSQSIQAINEAVDSGDAAQTLAALRSPGGGLYGVTSECAQTYQDDLAKIKDEKKKEGEKKMFGWIRKKMYLSQLLDMKYNFDVWHLINLFCGSRCF